MSGPEDDGRDGGSDPDDPAGRDPAAIAGAAPEPDAPADPVHAVGIGPGNREYVTPRAERAIRDADVVVGFETVVGYVADLTGATLLSCGYADETATLAAFAGRVEEGERGVAVLMGDPNFSGYQFLGKVQAAVDRPVRVVPGVSALQVAASRARTAMEETAFVTLHRSGDVTPDLQRLREAVGDRHLLVLPRPYDWMPGDIAAALVDAGASADRRALVLERLTLDDETITRTTLGDLADFAGGSDREDARFSDLSVLAVRAERGRP